MHLGETSERPARVAMTPSRSGTAGRRGALGAAALSLLGSAALSAPALASPKRPAAPSALEIVTNALKALSAAPALKISGTLHTGSASVTLTLASTAGGARAVGAMTSSTQQLGFVGTFSFVHLDGTSYVKGDKAFWRSAGGSAPAARIVNALASRWVTLDGKVGAELSSSLSKVTSPSILAHALLSSAKAAKHLRKGAPTRVDGQRAIPVRSSAGGTLYVASTGTPRPLEITKATGADSGTLVFAYPSTVTVHAPSGAVRFSKLGA